MYLLIEWTWKWNFYT